MLRFRSYDWTETSKRMWLSAEVNTVLISGLLAIVGAGIPMVVAWLRMQTKKLTAQAEENRAMLNENVELTKTIQRQTDGLTKKMQAIASVVGFTKGRVQGREEGESKEPYQELTKLEDEISRIMKSDYSKPKT